MNIIQVQIDADNNWALLDSGFTINAVTTEFIEVWSLHVGPLSSLSDNALGINGFKAVFPWPLGYIFIRAQVEGVWGYDEDQVALVVPESTGFGSKKLVTLGAPNINWVINVIMESKINELSVSLNGSRIDRLLACWQARLSIQR